ncbi:hypothetical protein [Frigoriglobus tundricola]|uniref:Uncharacterized protein n=1 Tax=Frigoriglobus tundricola TaxID=2774151 RepID=A0A6M5YK61_9BACT|nr:hypothetical protein [Frigoriglobus tundricola]QJW93663.1 hypothetical protein FTUN_1171 [Frigoriglobus tundricola]
MFSRWKARFEPWRTEAGWEFDLLRALPPDVANRLYRCARRCAELQLMLSWRFWVVLGLVSAPASLSFTLVWIGGWVLGLGPAGRFLLEAVYHVLLGALVLHPLMRLQERHLLPHIRTALAEELVQFARDELAPPRRAHRPRVNA